VLWGRRDAVVLDRVKKGVSGVRGEQGDGGIERWLDLKGVGLMLRGFLVLVCGIVMAV